MFGYNGQDDISADAVAHRLHFGLVLAIVFTVGVLAGLSF
jgi:hypothetical protein